MLGNDLHSLTCPFLPQTFAIFWTFAGLIAILVTVLAVARGGRRSADFALGGFEPSSGWPDGWSFCVGLLHAAYATSSTGMVISMCEEVQHPATQVPKAMVITIVINTIGGLLFLVPLMFVLPDLAMLVALPSAQPVPTIIKSAVGSSGGAIALLIPLMVLAILCGVACTTAASRCTWAFARDGAIPGSGWWKQVHPKLDLPLNAMMLSMVIQILLGVIYFGSATAFNAFSGVGVISLTLSYAAPIAVSMLERRAQVKGGKFYLGKFGWLCNCVAIGKLFFPSPPLLIFPVHPLLTDEPNLGWSVLAVPLFCMPALLPVSPVTVNYAPVVFVGFVAIASAWYAIWGREHYQGPPTEHLGQPLPGLYGVSDNTHPAFLDKKD